MAYPHGGTVINIVTWRYMQAVIGKPDVTLSAHTHTRTLPRTLPRMLLANIGSLLLSRHFESLTSKVFVQRMTVHHQAGTGTAWKQVERERHGPNGLILLLIFLIYYNYAEHAYVPLWNFFVKLFFVIYQTFLSPSLAAGLDRSW